MSVVSHPALVRRMADVIVALNEGLGVEDIAARGIAPAAFARECVTALRDAGALDRALGLGAQP